MKCLQCKKEVSQTPGKRKKEFCNNTCRSNYWYNKNNKKDQKQAKVDPVVFVKPGPEAYDSDRVDLKKIKDEPFSLSSIKPKNKKYDYKAMPSGLTYFQQMVWKEKAREEQNKKSIK